MKILIVDDEPLARLRLKKMLSHFEFNQVLEANHGEEGVAMTSKHLPDLVFMDIEMPVMGGMEAAAIIKQKHPGIPIIFSTAHDEFALQAFDISAVDYMLKPLSAERLKQALEKVGISCGHDKIRVKKGNELIMVAITDIICLVAEDKYVTAHLCDQTLLIDQSLAELEQAFSLLFRVHRNALINIDYLQGIHSAPGEPPKVMLDKLDWQPVISRRQLPALKKIIQGL